MRFFFTLSTALHTTVYVSRERRVAHSRLSTGEVAGNTIKSTLICWVWSSCHKHLQNEICKILRKLLFFSKLEKCNSNQRDWKIFAHESKYIYSSYIMMKYIYYEVNQSILHWILLLHTLGITLYCQHCLGLPGDCLHGTIVHWINTHYTDACHNQRDKPTHSHQCYSHLL